MKPCKLLQISIFLVAFPLIGYSQNVSISGYVKHSQTGEAIENSTIFESQSGIGTITNNKGYFKLILKAGEINFKASETGFIPIEKNMHIKNDTILNLYLKPLMVQHFWHKKSEEFSLSTSPENREPKAKRKFLFF